MALCWISVIHTLIALLVTWRFLKRLRDHFRYNYPPGPKRLPILGNILNVPPSKLHLTLFDGRDKYGDVSYYNLAGTRFVVLNSVEAIQEAMKDPKFMAVFSGRPKTFFGQYVLNDGIFQSQYSKAWLEFRKLTHNVVKSYSRGLKEIEMVVISELDFLKRDLETREGKAFDVHLHISRSVGNIIYIMTGGVRYDYTHPIHTQQRRADFEIMKMYNPFVDVSLTTFPFMRHFNIGLGRIYQTTMNSLNDVVQYLYDNLKRENTNGILKDLLAKQGENEWLTDEMIIGVVKDTLAGGVTTTTSLLHCILFILLHRQDVQKRLQEEVDYAVGRDNDPCLDDMVKMPYTQAVILETMRFNTMIPFAPHSAMDDATFRGFHIKKDTLILCNIWRVHHDPELWEEPWTFRPERYLGNDGTLLPPDHHNRRHTMLFGIGKRRCIGEVLAKTRMFLFLTHLCQRFTMYADNPADLPSMDPRDYLAELMVTPHPFLMRLQVRQ